MIYWRTKLPKVVFGHRTPKMEDVVMMQTSGAQLAQWIRAGLELPNVVEVDDDFGFRDKLDFCGCALFCCLVGKEGSAQTAYEKYLNRTGGSAKLFAEELGIDLDLAQEISRTHCNAVSASEIADCLEGGIPLETED